VTDVPPGSLPPADLPLVFVDDLGAPTLSADDHHHLRRVLRVRDGAPITISDGRGRWCSARFDESPELDSTVHLVDAAAPRVTVAFALVKGGRPELVIQKLTELGVDVIIPFVAERSVVRWTDGRDERRHERLERVAREAAMQCRRVTRPTIGHVAVFDDVVGLPGAAAAERHGRPPSLEHPTLLVGPEGGWSELERARLPTTVGLGALVLRAETAAISGAALLTALRSGLVAPIRGVPMRKPS
jgi:16S rRNA (uracil1498-N3)-methyltransferase